MTTVQESDKNDGDLYCLHSLKYEHCIYIVGILGALSQIFVFVVILGLLITRLNIPDEEEKWKEVTCSAIAMTMLLSTAFSEILLMRAVNQRMLPYIQWWMVSSLIVFLLAVLLAVIAGFSQEAAWITLTFVYLVIRLPFQMMFVDNFAHAEIMSKHPHHQHFLYKSILYRRFK